MSIVLPLLLFLGDAFMLYRVLTMCGDTMVYVQFGAAGKVVSTNQRPNRLAKC